MRHTPDSGTQAASNINETNCSATYAFGGILDGPSLRARYAIVDFDSEQADDFRIYPKRTFSFGGKKS